MIAIVIYCVFVSTLALVVALSIFLRHRCYHDWTAMCYILTVKKPSDKCDVFMRRCRKCGEVDFTAKDTIR